MFDDVIASLVLHYLQDWGPALAELRRVLKPGGRLIVSVDHPFAVSLRDREWGRKADYFATTNFTAEWTAGGQSALLSFWHRPLHAMTDAFTAAGFRITVISEPSVAPDTPPRPALRQQRGQAALPVLPILRPARRLATAVTGHIGAARRKAREGPPTSQRTRRLAVPGRPVWSSINA
jgi:SAM-dependent methyltransferase